MGPFLRSRAAAVAAKENGESGSSSSEESVSQQLRPEDVLVGRGKGAYLSEGNLRYMQVINSFLPAYRAAPSTQDKIQITKDIVEHVRGNGGRFMGIDGRGNLFEVPFKQARTKVGQALRHKRRQLENEISGGSGRSWTAKVSTTQTAPVSSDGTKLSQTSGSQRDKASSSRGLSHRSRPHVSNGESALEEGTDDDAEDIAFAARLNSSVHLKGSAGGGRLSQEAADYLSDDFSLLSLAESDKQSTFNTNSASINGDKKSCKSSDTQASDKKPAAKRVRRTSPQSDRGQM